ncbi:GNAT family N-acetyltransferase [Dictyobacter kobayashii]|uniref:N-acetyltransferase domain-containing protein n=1 Tax=Dictyobacter kobayashii TaxID=2014872 RepID=A0A402AXD7_9CHLR|nr:GNAT family N-acetyltransferase [Dictyobacter kobayashii]GCE23766.1 hypothetical protein KDK_75660 [Dictyobacter kobayashii]
MDASVLVRPARLDEVTYIIELIDRVQKQLAEAGSLQVIGPIPYEIASERVSAGNAFVLELGGRLAGSVFVRPVTAESCPHLERWQLIDVVSKPWFLQKLALEPALQGQGSGYHFLAGLKKLLARRDPGATIFLDCWAGNTNLRNFYTRAGFSLYGIFPEHDYSLAVFTSTVL